MQSEFTPKPSTPPTFEDEFMDLDAKIDKIAQLNKEKQNATPEEYNNNAQSINQEQENNKPQHELHNENNIFEQNNTQEAEAQNQFKRKQSEQEMGR